MVITSTVELLKKETNEFFMRHWDENIIGSKPPLWHEISVPFDGSVPNYDKAGCYALVDGDSVIYIGIGVSEGFGPYMEHGISRRLLNHVIKGKEHHTAREKWLNISRILTIGFNKQYKYMALSLEDYLIWKLKPIGNQKQKR